MNAEKTAILYRMVMDKHVCPWGLRARHLLKSHGYVVDDRWLTTREQTDAFKAVYIQKRELKCACVGGDSNVPLGFLSLTENVMMVLMAVWMGWMAWV